MILEVFSSGPAQTNSMLVGCDQTKVCALVDAPPGCADHWIQRISQLGLNCEKLLLTHTHWDHTASLAELKQRFGAALYVHRADSPNLREPGADGLPLLMPIEPVTPDHFLEEGMVIDVGTLKLQVIHTPGHSPGGVCFYLEKEKTLLSGDTLFRGSIGNLSFPQCEPEKMWESLKKLSQLPADTEVFPGHGPETTIGQEIDLLKKAKEYFGG